MTWSASSTQSHSTDSSMQFTPLSTTGNNSNPQTLTVDVQATGNPFHHSHIGRHHRKHPTQRTIQTSDITTIVAFALNTCIFRACNNTYKQIRGAGIGSQLSPALCNVAITLIEHSWHQIHNNLLQHTDLHFTYYRYVDNRFIVHNEHFLQHPAIQTLIHHNFFGDPVELEPVEDFHLLGFNIDLPQRTITYMQPSQPWKIRDSTTAGSQRLALSGLQSRLHTIRKYTFPPSSADAAAAELVNLYVQKGHNYHACHRFLKKAPNAATCVCPPLDKGSSATTLSMLFTYLGQPLYMSRGHGSCFPSHANEAMGFSRKGMWTHIPVPALTTVDHAVQSSFFVSMVIHDTSHKPTLPQQLSRRSSADVQRLFSRTRETTLNISSDLTQSPCRSTAILPIVEIESLNTSVRVSECACVFALCFSWLSQNLSRRSSRRLRQNIGLESVVPRKQYVFDNFSSTCYSYVYKPSYDTGNTFTETNSATKPQRTTNCERIQYVLPGC